MEAKMKILFDLDDTLLDFKAGERNAIKVVLKEYNIELNDDIYNEFSRINEEEFQAFEKGIANSREIFWINRITKFFNYLGININKDEAFVINKEYLYELENGAFLIDGAEKTLEYLSKKHDLFVASNGVKSVQINRLKKANIYHYFKDLFISSEIGYNKPKKEFFDYIFNKYGYDYKSYIMVGDRQQNDIQGGINSSILTCLYNPFNSEIKVKPNYCIFKLTDLINFL